jgi:hypothetical protein
VDRVLNEVKKEKRKQQEQKQKAILNKQQERKGKKFSSVRKYSD